MASYFDDLRGGDGGFCDLCVERGRCFLPAVFFLFFCVLLPLWLELKVGVWKISIVSDLFT